jgi:hypothetical protein
MKNRNTRELKEKRFKCGNKEICSAELHKAFAQWLKKYFCSFVSKERRRMETLNIFEETRTN